MGRQIAERWLVTGAAGFIGSHLVRKLLDEGYSVRGLDNYSTGRKSNIEDLLPSPPGSSGPCGPERFEMIEGDITDRSLCERACSGVHRVIHLAALGSVPLSMEDPAGTFACNQQGFVNMITAAHDAGIKRFVYASSSSVYGDAPGLPKTEEDTGRSLSPYALSKWMNEETAELYTRIYGMECIGMRYFNVFGPRQDPEGAYAAVIPRWFDAIRRKNSPLIYGDGSTSRDFCYVDNAVAANILAATTENKEAFGEAFNVACEQRTTLNELFETIKELTGAPSSLGPIYEDFRPGDIKHSLASVEKARRMLGYEPEIQVKEGLRLASDWYMRQSA